MFKKLKGKVESSILYSRIEAEMSRVTHPVKNKVKESIDYAKEHPVKTVVKVASTVATVHSAATTVASVKALDTVVEDVVGSYVCGKDYDEYTAKLWAKLAMQDSTNKKLMKKAVTDTIKTGAAATVAYESHKKDNR